MTKGEIEAVFERVKTWPEERQAYAAYLLQEIEQDGDVFVLTEDDRAALEEALREEEEGAFATDEEVRAVFDRFR